MRIEESKQYRFVFPFMGDGFITLNVVANTPRDAAIFLKEWMSRAQLELAMEFPETSPQETTTATTTVDFNVLQIGLLEDLAKACNLDFVDLKKSIKDATGFEMTIENFKEIVPALEAIRDGAPPKNAKKK